MSTSKDQTWVIQCENGEHTIEIAYEEENSDYAAIRIDSKKHKVIKAVRMFNFEYFFTVEEKQCSIVKLTTEKTVRLQVDGEYVGIDEPYVKIPKVPPLVTIFIILNVIIVVGFVIYNIATRFFKIGFFIIMAAFLLCGFPIKHIANYPFTDSVPIKKQNIIKYTIVIISELLFLTVAIWMFSVHINEFL